MLSKTIKKLPRSGSPGALTARMFSGLVAPLLFAPVLFSGGAFPLYGEQGAKVEVQHNQESKQEEFQGFVERRGGIPGKIRQRNRIIIGLQRDFQPFHIENPKPGYPGIDVEVARAIADSLGVELEIRYDSLKELLKKTASGELDLSLGGISSSLERLRYVNFTDPYVVTSPSALLDRTVLPPTTGSVDFPKKKYESIEDLRGLGSIRIGVKSGTTHQMLMEQDSTFERHSIVHFATREKLLQALKDQEIDAMIGDGVYIRAVMLSNPELLNNYIALTGMYREEQISMAVYPGDPGFLLFLNSWIGEMRRAGLLREITKKYLDSGDWIRDE